MRQVNFCAVVISRPGCQSAGGGSHSTEGAPSSATEAQWEESRKTALSGSFLWPYRAAAQVSLLQYGDEHEVENILRHYELLKMVSTWQVLEESRLYSSLPKTNTCEYFSPLHIVCRCIRCNYVVCVYLEWSDRGALLCDAERVEYRRSSRAEPVAICILERWFHTTLPVLLIGLVYY